MKINVFKMQDPMEERGLTIKKLAEFKWSVKADDFLQLYGEGVYTAGGI